MLLAYFFRKNIKSGRFIHIFLHFEPVLGGRWLSLKRGCCAKVDLVLKLLCRYLELVV
jgi:hypothetical protein